MKSYIHALYKSIYSKEWYKSAYEGELKSAVLYTIFLNLVVALLFAIYFTVQFFNTAPVMRSAIVSAFPVDLEVVVASGTVSMNQPSPYVVEARGIFDGLNINKEGGAGNSPEAPSNVLVIDLERKASMEAMIELDTAVLITSNEIATRNIGGTELQINRTANFPDMKINRAWVSEITSNLLSLSRILPIIIFVFAFAIRSIYMFLVCLLTALFVWLLLSKVFSKSDATYKKSYMISLYASTISVIFVLLAKTVAPWLGVFDNALVFMALPLILILLVFKKEGREIALGEKGGGDANGGDVLSAGGAGSMSDKDDGNVSHDVDVSGGSDGGSSSD